MPKKPRGQNLNERLKKELDQMLKDGHTLSPISRSTLQRKLGLNSRSTLSMPARADMIENARRQQLHQAGLDSSGKKRRNTAQEQIEYLKQKIEALEKDKVNLIEQITMIINGIQAKGYQLEELMMPLRSQLK